MKYLQILYIEMISCNSVEDLVLKRIRSIEKSFDVVWKARLPSNSLGKISWITRGGITREKEKLNDEENDDYRDDNQFVTKAMCCNRVREPY